MDDFENEECPELDRLIQSGDLPADFCELTGVEAQLWLRTAIEDAKSPGSDRARRIKDAVEEAGFRELVREAGLEVDD